MSIQIILIAAMLLICEVVLMTAGIPVVAYMANGKRKVVGRVFCRRYGEDFIAALPNRFVEKADTTKFQLQCSRGFRRRGKHKVIIIKWKDLQIPVPVNSNRVFYL